MSSKICLSADLGDFAPSKATLIKVIGFDDYFDAASPPNVNNALLQLAASYPIVGNTSSDTQVLINDGGAVSGDSGLTYNKTTDSLKVDGAIGINKTPALGEVGSLEMDGAGGDTWVGITIRNFSDNDYSTYFDGWRSRGTKAVPLAVQNNDNLFYLDAYGYDGTSWIDAAYLEFAVDGVVGTNDMPGRIKFFTCPDGSAVAVERMNIDSKGITTLQDIRTFTDGTVTRDANNLISSVALDNRTLTVTRNANNLISTISDTAYTWTFTRNVNNLITSWSVSP